jgi:hypothetical protein
LQRLILVQRLPLHRFFAFHGLPLHRFLSPSGCPALRWCGALRITASAARSASLFVAVIGRADGELGLNGLAASRRLRARLPTARFSKRICSGEAR